MLVIKKENVFEFWTLGQNKTLKDITSDSGTCDRGHFSLFNYWEKKLSSRLLLLRHLPRWSWRSKLDIVFCFVLFCQDFALIEKRITRLSKKQSGVATLAVTVSFQHHAEEVQVSFASLLGVIGHTSFTLPYMHVCKHMFTYMLHIDTDTVHPPCVLS